MQLTWRQIIFQIDLDFNYQKLPLSEQSRCAPQFVQIMWHACIEDILLSHLGHLISSAISTLNFHLVKDF